MPPRKTKHGIALLIGKPIKMESKYDEGILTGTLVSTDEDYLGVETEGKVFYWSKYVVRCITEDTQDVAS